MHKLKRSCLRKAYKTYSKTFQGYTEPIDTGRPGRLLNVLCTFNLRPVSKGF